MRRGLKSEAGKWYRRALARNTNYWTSETEWEQQAATVARRSPEEVDARAPPPGQICSAAATIFE